MAELYEMMRDGEITEIPAQGLDVACCDCGLVHRLKVVGGGSVRIRVRRMARATGQVRRWMKQKAAPTAHFRAGQGKTAK